MKEKSDTADPVAEVRGSDCSVGLECLLNVVRALGMGSCLSEDGASATRAVRYTPVASTSQEQALLRRRNSRRKVSRRDSTSYTSSDMETRLHRIPGRIFLSGSSNSASLFTKQGRKGVNQDSMIVWENFGSKEDAFFCGVFDGHGPYGHLVAKKVRDSLPLKLSAQWELDATYKSNEEEVFMTLKESFLKAFKVMDKELKLHPHIDCFYSGTTAATMVKKGQDIMIGNVGDSRAILGTRDDNDSLIATQLTVDLKPNLSREAERIRSCHGRVFALPIEPDVARVWMPNYDSPGLAMARAFGDFCLKEFGLISVPDIFHHRITERDEFVVLATDGVWDVLSNEEVVHIVGNASKSSAARAIVESANRAWRYKHPSSKIDDCAVVCIFLESTNTSSYIDAKPKTIVADAE